MKNNISFFTHETTAPDHRKFLILRAYYGGDKGWAMEARFWALNCQIAAADDCRLDLTLKGEKARVARVLELSLADLDAFLVVLRDEAELILDSGGVITTEKTQDDLARAQTSRKAARDRRSTRKDTPSGDERETSGDESQTSGDAMHRAEQSRQEERREAAAAREAMSPETRKAWRDHTLAIARSMPNVKRPEPYAKTIEADDEKLLEWLRARTEAAQAKPLPPPGPCDCGGDLEVFQRVNGKITYLQRGKRACARCGKLYEWDDDFEQWGPAKPALDDFESAG